MKKLAKIIIRPWWVENSDLKNQEIIVVGSYPSNLLQKCLYSWSFVKSNSSGISFTNKDRKLVIRSRRNLSSLVETKEKSKQHVDYIFQTFL